MERSLKLYFLSALLFCAGAPSMVRAASPILVISLAGLRPDAVLEADKHNLKIPNLRRLVAEGAYSTGVQGVLPTVTYPSHTTLVTGVLPAVHGILNNATFDPEMTNREGWYWYAEDLKAPTLWDAAAKGGLTTASISWPVTVGAKNIKYLIPEYWRAGSSDDHKLLRALSTPGLLDEIERTTPAIPDGHNASPAADEIRTKAAIYVIEHYHPQLLTLHFSAFNHAQHVYSPFSKEANAVLEALDADIGRLSQAAWKADSNAVVAVVSDHGFSSADREVNLNSFMIATNRITYGRFSSFTGAPTVTSWKAALWPAGGSAAVMLADPKDEKYCNDVREYFTELSKVSINGIAAVIDNKELRQRGAFPNACALIEMQPGTEIGPANPGHASIPLKSQEGENGYFPELPDMLASFFIAGKGIAPHQDLGSIDMRQVAPTLAAILGVDLPTADFKPIALK
jgi:predicted AlkP superfamily pyrophosphatase or phosphodiesterase